MREAPVYRVRSLFVFALLVPLAACSGAGAPGSPQALATSAVQPAAAVPVELGVPASGGTFTLPLSGGSAGSIAFEGAGSNGTAARLQLSVAQTAATTGRSVLDRSTRACPVITTISLRNPFKFALTLRLENITLRLPCTVDGSLFGVSLFQTNPQPATLTSEKLGDVTAAGNTITFAPSAANLTLEPSTTYALTILPEATTGDVSFDVTPGSTTVLTSNAPALPSALSFTYATGSGGSLYSAACFNAYDAEGELAAVLQGVAIEGKPSFYCTLTPESAPISFGETVQFTIGTPKIDASFLELDGPPQEFTCSASSPSTCVTPAFSIPTVQNIIVGNTQDIHACVALYYGSDCNNVANSSWPAPAATWVKPNSPLALLVADDPTYAAPTFGGFDLTIPPGSSCTISTAAAKGFAPAGYVNVGGPQENPPIDWGLATSALFDAIGPNVEFHLVSGWSGTCSVTISETTGLKRSLTFSIPISQ